MKRILIIAALLAPISAHAQTRVVIQNGTTPVSNSNPLPVSASFSPSGTQDINIKQVQGAVPSATNPLWVSPATASTPWAISAASGAYASGSVASGAFASGSIASGAMVDLGAIADAAATAGSTGTVSAKLRLMTTQLGTINTTLGTPMQQTGGTVGIVAGSAIIGNVRIDQTTPGTTNGTAIVGINATTALAGNGGTGTGSLRVTIANDNTAPTTWPTAANQIATQAPVAPATATATKSDLIGCQATSAAINPTTGQQAAIDCDLNNNVLVSPGGAPNLTTAQVTVTTSNTSVVAARALRRSVTITNITGTQQVYCSGTTATTGNGQLIPAVVGASWNVSTTAAINCIAVSSSQTVSTSETF